MKRLLLFLSLLVPACSAPAASINVQTILPYAADDRIDFEQQLSPAVITVLQIFWPDAAYVLQSLDTNLGIVTVATPVKVTVDCGPVKFQLTQNEDERYALTVFEGGEILLSVTNLTVAQRDNMIVFYEKDAQIFAIKATGINTQMVQSLGANSFNVLQLRKVVVALTGDTL